MDGIIFEQYKNFHCIGSECPYTCCGGYWRIEVDEDTDRFYQSCDGEFGAYLNKCINRDAGKPIMRLQSNGRCKMLDAQGLCSIQIAYGHEKLCWTCQRYPRIALQNEGLSIAYLTLSCPEVAREVLMRKTPIHLLRCEMPESLDGKSGIDTELAAVRRQGFQVAIRILQDRKYDIVHRQRLFLRMSRLVQEAIDNNDMRQAKKTLATFFRSDAYRALMMNDDVSAKTADKVQLLQGLKIPIMEGEHGFELPEIFKRAINYIQDDHANLTAFVEYFRKIGTKQQQRAFENLLVALLPGKYISDYADHNLYRQSAYIVILAQLYRVLSAVGYAGGVESETGIREQLLLSYICRFFDHTSKDILKKVDQALDEHHLLDIDFILRLVG